MSNDKNWIKKWQTVCRIVSSITLIVPSFTCTYCFMYNEMPLWALISILLSLAIFGGASFGEGYLKAMEN
jgi:ABC-type multidrug transport system permease subunit